jgi:arylsulfatase A-like enzyme
MLGFGRWCRKTAEIVATTLGLGAASPLASLRAIPVLGALALAIPTLIDTLVGAPANRLALIHGLLTSLGSAVAVGLLLGSLLALLIRISTPLSRLGRTIPWALVGLAVAFNLTHDLNAWQRLHSDYVKLAVAAIGGSLLVGTVWAGTGYTLTRLSSRHEPAERVQYQLGFTSVWLLLAAGSIVVDRTQFVGQYQTAHSTLRYTAWLAFIALAWPYRYLPFLTRRLSVVALFAVALYPFVSVRANHTAMLQHLMARPLAQTSLSLLRQLTDFDFDGYSGLLGGGDCAPLNHNTHPGATEIPGNGIDDNCLGGDAKRRKDTGSLPPIPSEPSPVSVVLITIDTLRADRMSLYGNKRITTPGIDKWAKSAMRFDRAYTSGTWTSLAIPSLFRGLYPRRLEYTRIFETAARKLLRTSELSRASRKDPVRKGFGAPVTDHHPTISELLKRRGMTTVAIVNDGSSDFLKASLNIAGKFDKYTLLDEKYQGHERNEKTMTKLTLKTLTELSRAPEPFFLWVHYYSTHERIRGKGNEASDTARLDMYDDLVAAADAEVSQLLDQIESISKKRRIGIVVGSDHGETVRARSRSHGTSIEDEQSHIPLIVKGPGIHPGVSKRIVSLVDVMPTILAWTKTPAPRQLDGISLEKVDEAKNHRAAVLTDCWRLTDKFDRELDIVGAVDEKYRLTWDLKQQTKTLRLTSDSTSQNLIEKKQVPALDNALTEYLEQSGSFNFAN